MAAIICITTLIPLWKIKIIFLSDVTFPSWPKKSVNPNFRQCQSDRNNHKFNCWLEIQSKTVARIYFYTINRLKLPPNQIHIWCQRLVVAMVIVSTFFFPNINVTKAIRNLLVLKITEKMTMIIDISTLKPLMRNRNFLIWRHFPAVTR